MLGTAAPGVRKRGPLAWGGRAGCSEAEAERGGGGGWESRRGGEERAEQPLLRETLQTKKAPDSLRPPAPQAGPLAPGPRRGGYCNFPPGLRPRRGGRLCKRVFVQPVEWSSQPGLSVPLGT